MTVRLHCDVAVVFSVNVRLHCEWAVCFLKCD